MLIIFLAEVLPLLSIGILGVALHKNDTPVAAPSEPCVDRAGNPNPKRESDDQKREKSCGLPTPTATPKSAKPQKGA